MAARGPQGSRNRTTTAGSGRCAESEAAAIVTKVAVGEYVKLQVWTLRCLSSTPGLPMGAGCTQCSAAWRRQGGRISLRVPAQRSFSLEDCVASGSLSPGAAQLLVRMIEARLAFLIGGGTGSGKTTLRLGHD